MEFRSKDWLNGDTIYLVSYSHFFFFFYLPILFLLPLSLSLFCLLWLPSRLPFVILYTYFWIYDVYQQVAAHSSSNSSSNAGSSGSCWWERWPPWPSRPSSTNTISVDYHSSSCNKSDRNALSSCLKATGEISHCTNAPAVQMKNLVCFSCTDLYVCCYFDFVACAERVASPSSQSTGHSTKLPGNSGWSNHEMKHTANNWPKLYSRQVACWPWSNSIHYYLFIYLFFFFFSKSS